MTNEEIKELLQIFNESGVGELEVQRGRDRLRIRKASEPAVPEFRTAPLPAMHETAPAASTAAPAASSAAAPAKPEAEAGHFFQKSPIVGTYYDAPSPGAAPFIKVGDKVQAGQILCIIESMKLMNEIEADISGTIAAKLVENGHPVEYGESLIAILPS